MKCFYRKLLIYMIVSIYTTKATTTKTTTKKVESCYKHQDIREINKKRPLNEASVRPFPVLLPVGTTKRVESDEIEKDVVQEMEPEEEEEGQSLAEKLTNVKANIRRKRKRLRQKKQRLKRKQQQQQQQQQHANILFATPLQLPTIPTQIPLTHKKKRKRLKNKFHPTTTTTKPKLIKYLLHKSEILKKKKQEYLSHLGYVFLPFVKFVAFFTVLNPFTLAVFFFMLISPIIFALLGFTAFSFILRPILNLLFAIKNRASDINQRRRRYQYEMQRKKRKNLHQNPQPITIHKHYYQLPTPTPRLRAKLPRPYLKTNKFNYRFPQQRQDFVATNLTENLQNLTNNFNLLAHSFE